LPLLDEVKPQGVREGEKNPDILPPLGKVKRQMENERNKDKR